MLSPKPVFLKTLISREPVIQKFKKKITDEFKGNYSGASVGFFLEFNICGMAYFETVIFNFFFFKNHNFINFGKTKKSYIHTRIIYLKYNWEF